MDTLVSLYKSDSTRKIPHVPVIFFLRFWVIHYRHIEGARSSSVVRVFTHGVMGCQIDPPMVDPLSYFLYQPLFHDWYTKGRGMCYPVCGMVHINEPLLLIGKSSPCGSSRFPLSLSVWYFTICLTPYNRK